MHYIEFIDYFRVLSLVRGDGLCLGQNNVSFPVCQSNYIGELDYINSQKGHCLVFMRNLHLYCFFSFDNSLGQFGLPFK